MGISEFTKLAGLDALPKESIFAVWSNNVDGRVLSATLDYSPIVSHLTVTVMQVRKPGGRSIQVSYAECRNAYVLHDELVFVENDGREFIIGAFAPVVRGEITEMRLGGKTTDSAALAELGRILNSFYPARSGYGIMPAPSARSDRSDCRYR